MYYSVRKVSDLLFLRKPGEFQQSELARGDFEPYYACVNFLCLSIASVDHKLHLFEWHRVQSSRRILIVRKMTKRFGFRVVPVHPGLVTSDYGVCKSGSLFAESSISRVYGYDPETIFFLQWKSDKSTKHYLAQMLLAINWCYWTA